MDISSFPCLHSMSLWSLNTCVCSFRILDIYVCLNWSFGWQAIYEDANYIFDYLNSYILSRVWMWL
jgi:hypothetical protein